MVQQIDALDWSLVASIFSELNEYVLITDNEGDVDKPPNVLYCNEGFEKHTGYTLAEIQEHSFSILVGPDTDEEAMQKIRQSVREEKSAQTEFVFYQKSGKPRWVDLKLNPVRDEEGEVQYWIHIGRDITDLKKSERENRFNYLLFRQLFDSSPQGIALISTDGIIHDINTEFERLFKYVKSEITGHSLFDLVFPRDEKDIIEETKQKLKSGEQIVRETVRLTKDGDKRPVIVTGTPVEIDGEVEYAFGIYTDIKELKEKEFALAESLDEKKMLLQEIHHRVKNNLAIISGLLELQGYEVDEGAREAFRNSQIRIQSMSKVHEALYNSPSLSDVDLNDYLRELVDSVKQSHGFDEKNIELKYDIDPGMSMNINEAVPLALLISELITNAYKHAFESGDEGVITVEAKRDGDNSYVAVIDNGRGLDKDEFKNSQSLGGNIIRSLTQQLGAEMNISTDNGTRFEIHL